MDRLLKNCRIKNQLLRECLAEFLGVYVLIVSKDTFFTQNKHECNIII